MRPLQSHRGTLNDYHLVFCRELFQSCDSDVGGGYSCGLSDTNPGGQERDEDWQVDQLAVRMLAAGILLDLQLRTQRV